MTFRHRVLPSVLVTMAALVSTAATPVGRPVYAQAAASPDQPGVSLDRGWVHLPAVAPGLVFTDAYNGEGIVAGGPGLVAYEQQGGGFRMYGSATGQDWAQLPGLTIGPDDIAQQLFVVGQRFIVTGGLPSPKGFVPRVWASSNGGQTWQESPTQLQISAVVPGGDGVIAFVSVRTSTDPWTTQLWTSADGVTWRQLPDRNGAFESGNVTSAAEGGPGYVAGGFSSEKGGPGHATVWTSPDGVTWTEVPDAATVFAGSITGISQVVAGPAGVAAVAEVDSANRGGIWASRDGVHWRRAADGFLATPAFIALPLAVWHGGFAEIQDLGTGAELYSSPDGLTWTRVGSDGVFGGSAWATAMIGFRGGLAAIGGYAPHPRAHCLPDVSTVPYRLGTLKPSVLLWTPEASQAAPARTLDPADPWALRLLPGDFPPDYVFPRGPHVLLGQFVNLCAYVPALGRHRAYLLQFDTGARGLALDIETQRAAAAKAAFRQADRLVAQVTWSSAPEPAVQVERMRELRATARIGTETRVFAIHVKDYECGYLDERAGTFRGLDCKTSYYDAVVVAWRHGRIIGLVVSDEGRSFALDLARKLLARSEHPSD